MSNNDFTIKISEMGRIEITWETCKGGQSQENIYIVTPQEWNEKMEGFIGYFLDPENNNFTSKPYRITFDGLAYAKKTTEEIVEGIIGKEVLQRHKERMQAIETLLRIEPPIEIDDRQDPTIEALEGNPVVY